MKRVAFSFLIAFSLFINQLQAQIIHCIWEKTPVSIDGQPAANEWPEIFNYYDGNTKLQFAFASDTGNLYVALKITDDPTQMRLFNGGLGIWIDPKGKKKETMGVSFPLRGDRAPGTGEGGGEEQLAGFGVREEYHLEPHGAHPCAEGPPAAGEVRGDVFEGMDGDGGIACEDGGAIPADEDMDLVAGSGSGADERGGEEDVAEVVQAHDQNAHGIMTGPGG